MTQQPSDYRTTQGQQPWHPQQHFQQPYPAAGPPPRRKKRTARKILGAAGGVLGVIIVASVAVSHGGTHTISGTSSPSTATAAAHPATPSAKAAGIGDSIVLTGNTSGEQVTVTVTKVWPQAQPATQFDTADAGDRLYAVQFRLDDTGSAAYSDSPSNGAVVVDSSGQSYQSSFNSAAECDSFPGTENIAPGSSGLGCIVFEVPAKAQITAVQFTLDSGMGPQTGQWAVASKGTRTS
jgi:hypothetical protein